MSDDIEKLQSAFEAFESDHGLFPRAIKRSKSGGYELMHTSSNWNAWQACAESMKAEQDKRFNDFEHDCQLEVEALNMRVAQLEVTLSQIWTEAQCQNILFEWWSRIEQVLSDPSSDTWMASSRRAK